MNVRAMVIGLSWDVGLPVAAYYLLHAVGVSDWVALLTSTLVSALRIGWVAARERSLNLFATLMLVVFGVGLVLSFVSGDPRFLLVKESFVTGAVGLVFLATTVGGRRPLTLAAVQSFSPGAAARTREEYDTDPHVRHGHRFSSRVWGAGLLAEALLRVPLVYLLPVEVMVGLSTAMMVAVFAGLTVWNVRWVARAKAQAPPAPACG